MKAQCAVCKKVRNDVALSIDTGGLICDDCDKAEYEKYKKKCGQISNPKMDLYDDLQKDWFGRFK